MRRATKLLAAFLVLAACSSGSTPGAPARATGPPRLQADVVRRHAAQFDRELPHRPAGSQQEEAAAAYILGHLQREGYVTRLEAVPVANTVNSTDVISVPPAGGSPRALVAVAYDTADRLAPSGRSIGVFLELARALAAARPRHSVGFAALGAERAPVEGGHLGSRRLARLLLDAGQRPLVITIETIGAPADGAFAAMGSRTQPLVERARALRVPVTAFPRDWASLRDVTGRLQVFRAAGLDHAAVAGGPRQVGKVLLDFLLSPR